MEFLKNWVLFYGKEVLFFVIIFLVGSTSFALGYLANREFNHTPIIIEKCPEATASIR